MSYRPSHRAAPTASWLRRRTPAVLWSVSLAAALVAVAPQVQTQAEELTQTRSQTQSQVREQAPEPVQRQVPTGPATTPTTGAPQGLRIPEIGLREDLVDLGIARDGTMQVPSDPDRVGWFTGGGRPGGAGPTVLVGHVDSVDGPAVFARLSELEPGDRITVATPEGPRDYRVSGARDVPQDDFPTAEVFGATRGDVLRLITCSGPYDREVGRYTENRVVSAVPA